MRAGGGAPGLRGHGAAQHPGAPRDTPFSSTRPGSPSLQGPRGRPFPSLCASVSSWGQKRALAQGGQKDGGCRCGQGVYPGFLGALWGPQFLRVNRALRPGENCSLYRGPRAEGRGTHRYGGVGNAEGRAVRPERFTPGSRIGDPIRSLHRAGPLPGGPCPPHAGTTPRRSSVRGR